MCNVSFSVQISTFIDSGNFGVDVFVRFSTKDAQKYTKKNKSPPQEVLSDAKAK